MNKLSVQHNQFIIFLFLSMIAWLGMGMATLAIAASSAEASSEYAVKAAFLFKFGAFIDWAPDTFESPSTPLVIGIVGDDPFGNTLDQIVANRTIAGRPVAITRDQKIDQIKGENILFISQSEKMQMNAIVAHLQGKKILTVAEFEDPNIIIHFVIEGNKVRFDINLAQANRVGIKISSKLLSVARTITKE
jgi:hypothetical protein